MQISLRRPCGCGHGKDAHEHYRRGTDCSACACVAFKGQLEVTLRFGRSVPAGTIVVLPDEVPAPYEPFVRPTHSAGLTTPPAVNIDDILPPRVVEPRAAEQPRLSKRANG